MANTQDTVVSSADMLMESRTQPTTGEAPGAAMKSGEQEDVSMSEAGDVIAASNGNSNADVRSSLNPGPTLGAGPEPAFSPELSFTANSGSGLAANFNFGPIVHPSRRLFVDSGSNVIFNPGSSHSPDASLKANPMTRPLAQPLFEPAHRPLLRSTQDPPYALVPPMSATSVGTPAMQNSAAASSVASSSTQNSATAASVETPAMLTSDETVPVATWSMQNLARTGSVATPVTASSMTVSADEDSDDYDLNVVIRKESAKKARPKELDHGLVRPDPGPIPPAFRTASLVDVNTFPDFLTFQTNSDSSKDGGKSKVNYVDREVHKGSKVNKTVDKGEGKKRKKHRSSHSSHHHHHHNNTNTNTNSNGQNSLGVSRKEPIVIEDSGDEGGEAATSAAKKIKTGKFLSLTRENLGALEASRHKSLVANNKSSSKKTHKGSKPHKKNRHQDVRHHSSLPGINGPAGDTSRRAEKAARTESNATRVDKAAKPNEGPRSQTAASAANAAAPQRIDTQTWFRNLIRPAEKRPTPISTAIGPTPAPRSVPSRAPPPPFAATRPTPQATPGPALSNAQDKAEEFKRKRIEDNKRREQEIAAYKEVRERQSGGGVLPTDDSALFQALASKVPPATKTRIVADLPSNNYQRPEKGKRAPAKKITPTQGSTNIFLAPPRPAAPGRRPAGRPRRAPAQAAPRHPAQNLDDEYNDNENDDNDNNDSNDEQNYQFQPGPVRRPAARNRTTTPRAHPYYHYQPPPAPASLPRAPPRHIQAVPALAALGGPGRLVLKWTVYRTKAFIPQGVETRADYKVEWAQGTSYASHVANDKAHGLWVRPKKGVVGKSVNYVASRKGGAKLFDGWVKYDDGRVQYFWVEEGLVDLEEAGRGLMVDAERAEVVRRWRWDVVSVHLMKREGEEEGEKENTQEKAKVLLVECGGEEEAGEERQAENEHGKGSGDGEDEELWGEAGAAVETTANVPDNTPTTTPTNPTAPREFLDSTKTIVTHHGCFSTETDAKKGALKTFLGLAQPGPSQPDEDKYHFEYKIKPEYQEIVNNAIETGAKGDFSIEWEPETKYQWSFFRLTVEVVKTELEGPIDISDLVVEGPEGVPSGDTPAATNAPRPVPAKENRASQTQPSDPAPSLLKPSTPPPPSPERRWAPVAPATAPEHPAPVPNPAAPVATGTSSAANLPPTTTAAGTSSTANLPPPTAAAAAGTSPTANLVTTTPPTPTPTHPVPPAQAALYAAAQAARHAAAGLPHRPAATATPPFAQTRAPFAMVGDDESEVSEEE